MRDKRKLKFRILMGLMMLLTLTVPALAGNLEPPAPPGPTMKTLDQVEPRIPITSLPFTITNPGSYYLTGDLTSISDGIIVNADNVTINLMGYSLIGPGSGTNHGIVMQGVGIAGASNIEVRNGTVRNFGGNGIYESDSTMGNGYRIIQVRAVGNGGTGIGFWGAAGLPAHSNLIKDCTATDNGFFGIRAGPGSVVVGNTAYNNNSDGIVTEFGCTVVNNAAYSNQGNGFQVDSGSTVIGNTASKNGSKGMYIAGNSTVKNNTVVSNQREGIYAHNCTLIGNTISSNNLSGQAAGGLYVTSFCLVKGNNLSSNNLCNIVVSGVSNVIEENFVGGSATGIKIQMNRNFYKSNRARNFTTNYDVVAGNIDGGDNISIPWL